MAAVKIQNMGGTAPRISPPLLGPTYATVAENVKLWSGEIKPIREPLRLNDPVSPCGRIQTLYNIQSTWFTWCRDVDVVTGFTPNDLTGRFYYTGDGIPKVSNYSLATSGFPYPAQFFPLGIPAPFSTLALNVISVGTAPDIRGYVYTYVTTFDEESAPSPVSAFANVGGDGVVDVTGFAPSPNPNVNRIRLYRTLTGQKATEFLFVAEFPDTTALFTDAVNDNELVELLPSQGWIPPPGSLAGLNASPNGFLSGFVGNVLWYSEPYQPHAWPSEYQKILDYPIVATAWYGNNQVVMTTGFTYVVSGIDPRSLSVQRLPDPYPCVSKKSVVSSNNGVLYAAEAGIIFVGSGGLLVLTSAIIDKDSWAQYNPRSIRAAVQEGRYYGFYDFLTQAPLDRLTGDLKGACVVFDYNDRANGVDQNDKFNIVTLTASAVYADPVTPLHLVNREIFKFDSGAGYLPIKWYSKEFKFPYLVSLGAAKVWTAQRYAGYNVTFKLFSGGVLKYTHVVQNNEPFRLPRFYRNIPYILGVEGVADIQQLMVATSIEDMTNE